MILESINIKKRNKFTQAQGGTFMILENLLSRINLHKHKEVLL